MNIRTRLAVWWTHLDCDMRLELKRYKDYTDSLIQILGELRDAHAKLSNQTALLNAKLTQQEGLIKALRNEIDVVRTLSVQVTRAKLVVPGTERPMDGAEWSYMEDRRVLCAAPNQWENGYWIPRLPNSLRYNQ